MLMSEKSSSQSFGIWKVQLHNQRQHQSTRYLGKPCPPENEFPILSPVLEQADTLARISNCVGRNEAFAQLFDIVIFHVKIESLAWWQDLVLLAAGGLRTRALSHSARKTANKDHEYCNCRQKTISRLKVEKYCAFLGQLNCDKPFTTHSQLHIAQFIALALRHFAPSGLLQ